MKKCCIRGCNSDSSKKIKNVSFFRFPKKESLLNLWIDKIGSENIKPLSVKIICSKHFGNECINRTLEVTRLKEDVVPTIFPFTTSPAKPRVGLTMNSDFTGNATACKETNISILKEELVSQESCIPPHTAGLQPGNTNISILKEEPVSQESCIPPSTASLQPGNTNFTILKEEPVSQESCIPPRIASLQPENTNISILKEELVSQESCIPPHTAGLQPGNHMPKIIYIIYPIPMSEQQTASMDQDFKTNTGTKNEISEEKNMKMAQQLKEYRKKIKVLGQKCRRLKEKVFTYQNTIDDLRQRKRKK